MRRKKPAGDFDEDGQETVSGITRRSMLLPPPNLTYDLVRAALEAPDAASRARAEDALIRALFPRIHSASIRGLIKRRFLTLHIDLAQEARDVDQAVLLELSRDRWKKLQSFDPARGVPFGGFVAMLARFAVATVLKVQTAVLGEHDLPGVDPEEGEDRMDTFLFAAEVRTAFRDWMKEHLTARDHLVFEKIYIQGETAPDVAASLGTSAEAIHTACNRIRHEALAFEKHFLSGSRPRGA